KNTWQSADGNTCVVIAAHSHGGVWAHAAAVQTQANILGMIDLDTNSILWSSLAGHKGSNPLLGVAPESFYQNVNGAAYDLEDVTPNNVRFAFEVVSSDARLFDDR